MEHYSEIGVTYINNISSCFPQYQPVQIHNWEMILHFNVHGSGKNLFGDGFALWYTKDRNIMGQIL